MVFGTHLSPGGFSGHRTGQAEGALQRAVGAADAKAEWPPQVARVRPGVGVERTRIEPRLVFESWRNMRGDLGGSLFTGFGWYFEENTKLPSIRHGWILKFGSIVSNRFALSLFSVHATAPLCLSLGLELFLLTSSLAEGSHRSLSPPKAAREVSPGDMRDTIPEDFDFWATRYQRMTRHQDRAFARGMLVRETKEETPSMCWETWDRWLKSPSRADCHHNLDRPPLFFRKRTSPS